MYQEKCPSFPPSMTFLSPLKPSLLSHHLHARFSLWEHIANLWISMGMVDYFNRWNVDPHLQQILHLPVHLHYRFIIQEHCKSNNFCGFDNWLGLNVVPAYSTPLRKQILHSSSSNAPSELLKCVGAFTHVPQANAWLTLLTRCVHSFFISTNHQPSSSSLQEKQELQDQATHSQGKPLDFWIGQTVHI